MRDRRTKILPAISVNKGCHSHQPSHYRRPSQHLHFTDEEIETQGFWKLARVHKASKGAVTQRQF